MAGEKALHSERLCNAVVDAMVETKASDIVVLDLSPIANAFADHFVICSGHSTTQIDAIADSVESGVHKRITEDPWRKEGKEGKEWILLDYVSVVVHIFRKDRRAFYELEKLWGDAKITAVSELSGIAQDT